MLTNRHHHRSSGEVAERTGCPVYVPREGMHAFTDGEPVTPYGDGDEPVAGVRAHHVGELSDDEYAIAVPGASALAVADGVVRWEPGGPLAFVPDQLIGDDPEAVKAGLRAAYARLLDDVAFEHLLLAHGDPFVGDGASALRAVVD